ncbi:MAG: septum formation initiator family protein [Alphaproteobacteria bacterium]|nr:septum formation initiator family protein [Alphaproteobacteria bacterium]
MAAIRSWSERLWGAFPPFLFACAVAYFGYHALESERGISAYHRLQGDIAETGSRLIAVRSQRESLERKAALLRSNGLDLDMLDERAREVLGLAGASDVVIFRRERQ